MCMKDNSETKQRSSTKGSATSPNNINTTSISPAMTSQQQQQQHRGLSPVSVSSTSSSSSSNSSNSSDDSTSFIDPIVLQQQEVVVIDTYKQNNSSTNGSSQRTTTAGHVRLRSRFQSSRNTNHDDDNATTSYKSVMKYAPRKAERLVGNNSRNNQYKSEDQHDVKGNVTAGLVLSKNVHPIQRLLSCMITIGSAMMVAFATTWFSLALPFVLAPTAAIQTYQYAKYSYDAVLSNFDNTIYTYGTDYILAICMLLLIYYIPSSSPSNALHSPLQLSIDPTAHYTRGLLGSYMISVLAGGLAHQYFTSISLQNTLYFRIIWTICVGAVAIASAFMGSAASSLIQLSYEAASTQSSSSSSSSSSLKQTSILLKVPILSVPFWFVYGLCVTGIVVIGQFSYQRPACDIFVVGITQFPSTCYMMFAIYYCFYNDMATAATTTTTTTDDTFSKNYDNQIVISNHIRCIGCCGFIVNAPLLPLYPLLVQYTTLSLGTINTILHTWLLIAWTTQGLSLRSILTSCNNSSRMTNSSNNNNATDSIKQEQLHQRVEQRQFTVVS